MAGEWRASTWGDEISLEYGKALRGHETAQGPYRVFGSNGPIGWTAESLAQGPGVILGRKGAYRGVEFSRAPFFVIDTAYYVVPKEPVRNFVCEAYHVEDKEHVCLQHARRR